MASNRYRDSYSIVCEMIKFALKTFCFKFVELINAMIDHGCSNESWQISLFCMLPKSSDIALPENDVRIAILQVFYNIFSRIIYNRLLPILDSHESHDQCGFRPGIRLEDALVVLETLISKTREWNIKLWIASLDLKKAFDQMFMSFYMFCAPRSKHF